MRALNDAEGVHVSTGPSVEEVTNVQMDPNPDVFNTDTTINDGKSGAEIRIEPKHDEPEPDLRVCEFCAKSFKEEP